MTIAKNVSSRDEFNKSISPVLLAAIAGRPEVLHTLLEATSDHASLAEMPCHKHLIWHVLMQCPSTLGNHDARPVTDGGINRGIAESPARRERVNGYEECIEMLLDAGFRGTIWNFPDWLGFILSSILIFEIYFVYSCSFLAFASDCDVRSHRCSKTTSCHTIALDPDC
jgi:hypothetical protein